MSTPIRVGTCSWADESLSKYWYPPGTKPAERLPYYAEHFDTVEVDSTYYSLPVEEMVSRWVERTPDDFVIHVKAFGVMTRHPVKVEQLPPDLRDEAPLDERGRVDRPSREFRGEVFRRFHEALEPLRASGKLGGILFQLPPYVVARESAFEYLEWSKEQLAGDEMMVEFRHASWLDDQNRDETLNFLHGLGATHVIVDAPRIEGARNVVPTVLALTSPTLYVRFHGRNAGTWNKRGGGAQERFDHLYSNDELREWAGPLRELAAHSNHAYALMNTNKWNEGPEGRMIPQGAANAQALRAILEEEGVPVTMPVKVGT
jgi:uncharacterized protein YecE (DUF72 family)